MPGNRKSGPKLVKSPTVKAPGVPELTNCTSRRRGEVAMAIVRKGFGRGKDEGSRREKREGLRGLQG